VAFQNGGDREVAFGNSREHLQLLERVARFRQNVQRSEVAVEACVSIKYQVPLATDTRQFLQNVESLSTDTYLVNHAVLAATASNLAWSFHK
jgi:hypothetical protein